MGAILRSHKTDDAPSSLLAKCDQRSRPCDKCELIDERTVPSSLIRTEISKRATVKTQKPRCLSNATTGKCSDHVPLKLTGVEDRTKGGASDSADMIRPEADDGKNVDVPFLNKSLGCIKEFSKGEVKPAQNAEVSIADGSLAACSLNLFWNWPISPKEHICLREYWLILVFIKLQLRTLLCHGIL
jgi:hypothetical protein